MSKNRENIRQQTNQPTEKSDRDYLGKGANLDVSFIKHDFPELYGKCVLRWVNNEKGRVQQMQSNGWEVVMVPDKGASGVWSPAKADKDSDPKAMSIVSRVVGSGQTVSELSAILMSKPKDDFANQERAALHRRAKETELSIVGGDASERAAGVDTYNKGSKIRVGD